MTSKPRYLYANKNMQRATVGSVIKAELIWFWQTDHIKYNQAETYLSLYGPVISVPYIFWYVI